MFRKGQQLENISKFIRKVDGTMNEKLSQHRCKNRPKNKQVNKHPKHHHFNSLNGPKMDPGASPEPPKMDKKKGKVETKRFFEKSLCRQKNGNRNRRAQRLPETPKGPPRAPGIIGGIATGLCLGGPGLPY